MSFQSPLNVPRIKYDPAPGKRTKDFDPDIELNLKLVFSILARFYKIFTNIDKKG